MARCRLRREAPEPLGLRPDGLATPHCPQGRHALGIRVVHRRHPLAILVIPRGEPLLLQADPLGPLRGGVMDIRTLSSAWACYGTHTMFDSTA